MYRISVSNRRTLKILAGGLVIASMLGACSPMMNNRGYIAEPNLVAAVRAGVDNKTSVQTMLGTPSATGTFDQNSWYYISKKSEKVAFFDDRIVDQKILVIHFDEKGYVKSIDRVGLAQARQISMIDAVTPTRGRELGFVEQIFGNVGRFNSAGAGQREPGQ